MDSSDENLASTLSVFGPGSIAPSAILYDAWESYNNRSSQGRRGAIRSIKTELAKAVDECIEAAGQEWESYWQRRLLSVRSIFLQADTYKLTGRAGSKIWARLLRFSQPYDFVNMGQTLKVLNTMRFHAIGIPLTYLQYAVIHLWSESS